MGAGGFPVCVYGLAVGIDGLVVRVETGDELVASITGFTGLGADTFVIFTPPRYSALGLSLEPLARALS